MNILLIGIAIFLSAILSINTAFGENWYFGAGGDFTCNSHAVDNIKMLKDHVPDIPLFVTVGDYSYQTNQQCWIDLVKTGFDKVTITQGNHEDSENGSPQSWTQLVNYFKTQLNPELATNGDYYSFQYKNAYFISVNTQKSLNSGSEQYLYLNNKLEAAKTLKEAGTIDYVFVYAHKMWFNCAVNADFSRSNCGDHSVTEINGYRNLIDLMFSYGDTIDIVFFGHDHDTQISENLGVQNNRIVVLPENDKKGVIFAVVGSYGRSLDSLPNADTRPLFQYLNGNYYLSAVLELDDDGNHIKMKVIRDTGQILFNEDILKVGQQPPQKEICNNGIDDDGDGLIDQDDPDCKPPIGTKEICNDGIDNDNDWLIDEPDCIPNGNPPILIKNLDIKYSENPNLPNRIELNSNDLVIYPKVENTTITIIKKLN